MAQKLKKLSLSAAILVALNTMIGGGMFVNPKQLAFLSGALSPIGYIFAALILLPLILCIADLARLLPVSGGLYMYSKTYISKFTGFLSGWSYFLAKTTSSAFLIHTTTSFFSSNVPLLQNINPIVLDAVMILFLSGLHIIGISVASKIQYVFTFMKVTPLLFGFAAGFFIFDANNFQNPAQYFSTQSFAAMIPACLYTLIGFEVICAIGGFLENPEKNIRRTILIAFSAVSIIAILFQIALFGGLGTALGTIKEPILSAGITAFTNAPCIARIMNGLVFASIIGGAFSMLGSNCWNLFTLANENTLPYKKFLTQTNRVGAPWVALIMQAATSITMIAITTQQLALQNMVVFSMFISFFMTCVAAFNARKKGLLKLPHIVPMLALGTCSYVLGMCLSNIIKFGISFSFLSFFAIGILAALYMLFFKKEAAALPREP